LLQRKTPLHQSSTPLLSYPVLLLSLVSIVCYFNSIFSGFVFDDVSAIKDNKDLRPNSPLSNILYNDFWGLPMSKEQSHKSYRPLTVLSFRLNYLVHGLSPLGYHLVNLLLHLLVTQLYYAVCRHYTSQQVSQIAALLFAVHPVHTEAVAGAVGRAELLSSIFFLLALLSYHKQSGGRVNPRSYLHLLLPGLAAGLAMLSKEQGVTVIGLCIVHELCWLQDLHKTITRLLLNPKSSPKPKELLQRLLPSFLPVFILICSLALLLVARLLLQGSSLPVFTKFDNPGSHATALPKALTLTHLLYVNLGLLFCPSSLCCDWTMGSIPLINSVSDPRNLLTLFTIAAILHLVFATLKTGNPLSRQLVMAIAWLVLPFIPAANLFFPVGFVVAERILYLPSMGFSLIVSLGFHRLHNQCNNVRVRNILWAAAGLLLLTHSLKTISRNADWRNEESIFLSGLKVNSRNAKLYNNVGHALESQKRFSEALVLFKEAAKVQPDDIGAHINIGRALNSLARYDEAETAYRTAKRLLPRPQPGRKLVTRIAPNSLSLFLNLGNLVARNRSRLEEADALYRQAIAMRGDYVQAYINRGDVLLKMNRTEEALAVYKSALNYDATNPDIHYNLGVVALEQGRPDQGLQYLNRALELDPQHKEALLNSAIVIQELGLPHLHQLAHGRLLQLKDLAPENERVFFNLGMLTMDDGNLEEAEGWFKKAIILKKDFRSALFNLALLLADQDRPLEAVAPLQQLLEHHPDHVKGLILLGDIYTNHIRDLDFAESCYFRILESEPGHVQARHNLCVVWVEKGQLEAAQTCLEEVLALAPQEDYIRKHLGIVRSKLAKARDLKDLP